jgi:hypothetical protein
MQPKYLRVTFTSYTQLGQIMSIAREFGSKITYVLDLGVDSGPPDIYFTLEPYDYDSLPTKVTESFLVKDYELVDELPPAIAGPFGKGHDFSFYMGELVRRVG